MQAIGLFGCATEDAVEDAGRVEGGCSARQPPGMGWVTGQGKRAASRQGSATQTSTAWHTGSCARMSLTHSRRRPPSPPVFARLSVRVQRQQQEAVVSGWRWREARRGWIGEGGDGQRRGRLAGNPAGRERGGGPDPHRTRTGGADRDGSKSAAGPGGGACQFQNSRVPGCGMPCCGCAVRWRLTSSMCTSRQWRHVKAGRPVGLREVSAAARGGTCGWHGDGNA